MCHNAAAQLHRRSPGDGPFAQRQRWGVPLGPPGKDQLQCPPIRAPAALPCRLLSGQQQQASPAASVCTLAWPRQGEGEGRGAHTQTNIITSANTSYQWWVTR
eukprot:364789-Chlamydomonas_euryale.AAC.14